MPFDADDVVTMALAPDAESERGGCRPWCRLATFWQTLTDGKHRVLSAFTHGRRHYAVACSATSGALSERERLLLQRGFLGQSQKSLANELGVSGTTVSVLIGRSLARIGLERRLCTAPLPVVLGALDHLGVIEPPFNTRAGAFEAGGQYVIASVPTFDASTLPDLTDAERSVAQLILDGLCQKAISARRGTSLRTIANQIASLSRKLEVGGRFALLRRWAELEGWARPTALSHVSDDGDDYVVP
jgi:DNA-binding CsgD family transcriptional regulator